MTKERISNAINITEEEDKFNEYLFEQVKKGSPLAIMYALKKFRPEKWGHINIAECLGL